MSLVAEPTQETKKLIEAVIKGEENVVRHWISQGGDPMWAGKNHQNCLDYALLQKNAEMATLLLRLGAIVDNAPMSTGGRNQLYFAITTGDVELVELMVARGADLHYPLPHDGQPLMGAAESGNPDMIEYLVSQGVEFCRDDKLLRSGPFALAVKRDHFRAAMKLMELLPDNDCVVITEEEIRMAARKSRVDLLRQMLSYRSPGYLNLDMALHTIAVMPNIARWKECLDIVLAAGANLNNPEWHPAPTILSNMELNGRAKVEALSYLVSLGLDLKGSAIAGDQLARVVFEKSAIPQSAVIEYLSKQGISLDVNLSNKTPGLHHLASISMDKKTQVANVELLLQHGANVDIIDQHGNSLLVNACQLGKQLNHDLVRTLISHGANVNLSNKQMTTALHSVCAQVTWTFASDPTPIQTAIDILLKAGADMEARNQSGKKPIELVELDKFPWVETMFEAAVLDRELAALGQQGNELMGSGKIQRRRM